MVYNEKKVSLNYDILNSPFKLAAIFSITSHICTDKLLITLIITVIPQYLMAQMLDPTTVDRTFSFLQEE